MKSKDCLLIIHFQPIEYYPPIQNLLNILDTQSKISVTVHTTVCNKIEEINFTNISIKRLSKVDGNKSRIARLMSSIYFNFVSTFSILKNTPSKVLFYETWSVFPVFISLKLLKRKINYFGHFHEYTSKEQLATNETFIYKLLNTLERKILKNLNWVSHTNENRLKLYLEDNPTINQETIHILPNYPPKSWSLKQKKVTISNPLKLVYVGSLSTKNMYTKEIIDWVERQNGNAILDIFSVNISPDVEHYIHQIKAKYIQIKGSVLYSKLPSILSQYHVGLVIYNGGNLNYVYNAPNKLFEYAACGLDVWFSKDLITSKNYIKKDSYPKILEIDFENLDSLDLEKCIDRKNLPYKKSAYNCEDAYKELLETLENEISYS